MIRALTRLMAVQMQKKDGKRKPIIKMLDALIWKRGKEQIKRYYTNPKWATAMTKNLELTTQIETLITHIAVTSRDERTGGKVKENTARQSWALWSQDPFRLCELYLLIPSILEMKTWEIFKTLTQLKINWLHVNINNTFFFNFL